MCIVFYTVASKTVFAEVCVWMAASQKSKNYLLPESFLKTKHIHWLCGLSGFIKLPGAKRAKFPKNFFPALVFIYWNRTGFFQLAFAVNERHLSPFCTKPGMSAWWLPRDNGLLI